MSPAELAILAKPFFFVIRMDQHSGLLESLGVPRISTDGCTVNCNMLYTRARFRIDRRRGVCVYTPVPFERRPSCSRHKYKTYYRR